MPQHYEDEDEGELLQDEDDNLLRDGEVMRVRMFMRDSFGRPLTDALGRPLAAQGRSAGYVFADTGQAERLAENRDFQKAELSARYKGGLQEGDHVRIGDRQLEVIGRNPSNNKLTLADTAQLDAETLKREAYDAAVAEQTNAWRRRPVDGDEPGGACVINGAPGRWCEEGGRLVCRPISSPAPQEASPNEFAIAGPLSDQQSIDAQSIKDAAYRQSVEELANAWRR